MDADNALRVIMDAIGIDTVDEVRAVSFTPTGLADLAEALADMIAAARAEGAADGAARERAAVAAMLRLSTDPAWWDVARDIEDCDYTSATGGTP